MGNNINSSKPVVSVVSSAIRPDNWMDIYNSVDEEKDFFEFFFVGPKKPNFDLPKNFFFLKSNVKPTQCWQIAFEKCKGEFVIAIADDVVFKTHKPLKNLVNEWKKINDDKIGIGCRYQIDGKSISDEEQKILPGFDTPYSPAAFLIKKNMFLQLNGFEKKFIMGFWHSDFCIRLYNAGGKIFFSNVIIDEKKKLKSRGSTLALDYWKEDRATFNKIWMKENPNIDPWGYELLKKSAIDFAPFEKSNLLTISQGPAGRWKYTNNVYSKIIVSEIFFFIRKYFRILLKMSTSYKSFKYYLNKLFT